MEGFSLQPAQSIHKHAIRGLVQTAHINPTGLSWKRFIVALSHEGEVIGCGQIKPHDDGTRELASIVVAPDWRGQGVARAIIEHLLAGSEGTLYLTCRSSLEPFYEKFGFLIAPDEELPPYFQRVKRMFRAFNVLGAIGEELLVMRRSNV